MEKITSRMISGGGVPGDAESLNSVADNIAGRTICAFGEACAWPTQSFVIKFREEFEACADPANLLHPTNPEEGAQRRYLHPA
jgi:NADH-quinone oxidoreductase subunit F